MPTEIKGVGEMRKALRKYTPDLNKALNKEMAGFLKPLARKSRGYIPADPMTNWNNTGTGKFPKYDFATVKRGIGYKTSMGKPNRSGFKSLAEIYNKSAAGSIYETAGRNKPNSQFVKNLERHSRMIGANKLRGRAIFRAYKEDAGDTQKAIIKALNSAKARFTGKAFI